MGETLSTQHGVENASFAIVNVNEVPPELRSLWRERRRKAKKKNRRRKKKKRGKTAHNSKDSNFSSASGYSCSPRSDSECKKDENRTNFFPVSGSSCSSRSSSDSECKKDRNRVAVHDDAIGAGRACNGMGIRQHAQDSKTQDDGKRTDNLNIFNLNTDLVTCCQSVATFLAETIASNSTIANAEAGPTAEYIYGYMILLFDILDLEPECCVIADIYFRRLLSNAKGSLRVHAGNWQRILVGACLLASKYVDDETVENIDFSYVLTGCSLEFMNKLESKFLDMLNWKLYVPPAEYSQRYSELAQKRDRVCDWDVDFKAIKPHFTVPVPLLAM